LQGLGRELRLRGLADSAKPLAAPRDHHIERRFDLAQVFIQAPHKFGEPLVVDGLNAISGFSVDELDFAAQRVATARR